MSKSKAVELPSCFALQSSSKSNDGKFLRYVHEDGDKNGQLQLDGEDALNPFTRFDVEPSRLHPGLVHIRCRYNRKYWVARQQQQQGKDGDDWWIVAGADEPEEDLTKPSCTLIKAVPLSSSDNDPAAAADDDDVADAAAGAADSLSTMTFRFVLAGRLQQAAAAETNKGVDNDGMLLMSGGTGSVGSCMCVAVGRGGGGGDGDGDDGGFTVLNLSNSGRLLPTWVVFKGSNGMYLRRRPTPIGNNHHLFFDTDDAGHRDVLHQIIYDTDALRFRVRSFHANMLWSRPNERSREIHADVNPAHSSMNSGNTLERFRAHPVVDNSFALSNTQGFRQYFCVNQTEPATPDMTNALQVAAGSLPREALIRIEEGIMRREVSDIVYALREATVRDAKTLTAAITGAVNDTATHQNKRLTVSFEEEETVMWDYSVVLSIGQTAHMRAVYPKIGLDGRPQVSAEFSGTYTWGHTLATKVKKQFEYEVTVPPRTKVTVRVVATKATCTVPFAYDQWTVYNDGSGGTGSLRKTDGLFTGVNSYKYHFETTKEPLGPGNDVHDGLLIQPQRAAHGTT